MDLEDCNPLAEGKEESGVLTLAEEPTTTVNFDVSTTHVRKSKPCDGHTCPVATCLRESLPGIHVMVHGSHVLLDGKELFLPSRVQQKIRRYDRVMSMGPFSFELDVPVSILASVRSRSPRRRNRRPR